MKLGEFKSLAREGIASALVTKRKVRWKGPEVDVMPMEGELGELEKTVADDELSDLFKSRLDDGEVKRKGLVVRPDIPRLDVRMLPAPDEIKSASMVRSRARLCEFEGMPDEETVVSERPSISASMARSRAKFSYE